MKNFNFKQIIALLSLPILASILISLIPINANAVPLYQTINTEFIRQPWQWVMWIVNILSVIVLIFISIATVLRVENLYYKRLLPALIIGIIMANLSFLICRLLIDVVQVPTGWMINAGGDQYALNATNMARLFGIDLKLFSSMTALGTATSVIFSIFTGNLVGAVTSFILSIILGVIAMLPVLILLLVLSFLLWIRIAVIWFLVAISPIAFFSYFIEILQGIWKTWWTWFLQWLLLGFLVVVVLKIGIMLTGGVQTFGTGTTFLRWLLGIATVVLAVWYIPFVMFKNVGGLTGIWRTAGHVAGFYGSGAVGSFGGKLASSKNKYIGKLGGGMKGLGEMGKRGFYRPEMWKSVSAVPFIGGQMSGGMMAYEEKTYKKPMQGVGGTIANVFSGGGGEYRKLQVDDVAGSYQGRGSAFMLNELRRSSNKSSEYLASILTGDESRVQKMGVDSHGQKRAMGMLIQSRDALTPQLMQTSWQALEQRFYTDDKYKQDIKRVLYGGQASRRTDQEAFTELRSRYEGMQRQFNPNLTAGELQAVFNQPGPGPTGPTPPPPGPSPTGPGPTGGPLPVPPPPPRPATQPTPPPPPSRPGAPRPRPIQSRPTGGSVGTTGQEAPEDLYGRNIHPEERPQPPEVSTHRPEQGSRSTNVPQVRPNLPVSEEGGFGRQQENQSSNTPPRKEPPIPPTEEINP